MDTALGVHQGHRAALMIGVACVLTALVWLGLAELGKRIPTPPRVVGQVVVVGDRRPRDRRDRRWRTRWRSSTQFKSTTTAPPGAHGTQTLNHLLGSSGSGRWQFWGAAVSEFRAHPLNGGGAGSWEAWWLQHGSLPVSTEFAHSLYLETMAELGIVGLLLLGGAVLVARRRSGALGSGPRSAEIAAAAACGIAFFAAAAYDWVWQLAGIAVVGVGMLGFALGALPSRGEAWRGSACSGRCSRSWRSLRSSPSTSCSPRAATCGTARLPSVPGTAPGPSEALAAKAIEPWAASPYLELGFVAEAEGICPLASHWRHEAIRRSRRTTGACGPSQRVRDQAPETPPPPNAILPRRAVSIRIRALRVEHKADE